MRNFNDYLKEQMQDKEFARVYQEISREVDAEFKNAERDNLDICDNCEEIVCMCDPADLIAWN